MSECSQDYNQIVAKFLEYTLQWKKVPEIVYLTIKALFQHSQMLQEHTQRNKQLITEQSIKLRQLQIQLKNNYNQHESIDYLDEISPLKQSGFKKNKKQTQRMSHQKNQYSNKSKLDNNIGNYKSVQMNKQERIYTYQQFRKIASDIFQQKMQIINNEVVSIQNIKKQLTLQIEENDKKIQKFMSTFKEEKQQKHQARIRDIQKQYLNKLQLQRANMKKFVQQTAYQNIKIWRQIDNLYAKSDKLIEQSKFCYSNPIYIKEGKQITEVQKDSKQQSPCINGMDRNKIIQMQSNLNKQFIQFKHKTIKQMTMFLKVQNLQPIIKKNQLQMIEKIAKINKTVLYLQKQMNTQKRQNLNHVQSKSIINIKQLKQQKKVSNSEQSLKSIQQSLQNLQNYFRQKLKLFKKEITHQMQKIADNLKSDLFNELKEEMEYRQKNMCQIVQINCDKVIKLQQKGIASMQLMGLKKSLQKLAQQMIMARFLHFGQNQSGQYIEWEKEVYNSMQQNFVWKNGSFYVTIVSAGLYQVNAGLFKESQAEKVEAFLMLNNQRISEFKQKDVPTTSKAMSRGCLFNECILVPPKSKIAIKLEGPFTGQAYLQLHKL